MKNVLENSDLYGRIYLYLFDNIQEIISNGMF